MFQLWAINSLAVYLAHISAKAFKMVLCFGTNPPHPLEFQDNHNSPFSMYLDLQQTLMIRWYYVQDRTFLFRDKF